MGDLLRGVHNLSNGAVRVTDRDGTEGGFGHHKTIAADQAENTRKETEGATAVMGVHQDKFQAAVMENSAAQLLAAVEADQVFLKAKTLFGSGSLLLGYNGSPAGFAQGFNDRIGREEGVTLAGAGERPFSVSGGDVLGELFAVEFRLGTAPHHVGSPVRIRGHHSFAGQLTSGLDVEFYCRTNIRLSSYIHTIAAMVCIAKNEESFFFFRGKTAK